MVVLDGVEDLCIMLLLLGVESRFVDFPFLFTFFFLSIIYLFISQDITLLHLVS